MQSSTWELVQEKYDSSENRKYETLFTLANGYRGFRGIVEFSKKGEKGNFISGVFDKSSAQVTELVNCQDPLEFNIYIDDEKIDIDSSEIIDFKRTLNMKEGVLYSDFTINTRTGKTIKINSERFVSRNNVHRWAVKYTIQPINFDGKIFLENVIDGTVVNSKFEPLNMTKHFYVKESYDLSPGIAVKTVTFDKEIEIIEANMILSEDEHGNILRERKYGVFGERVREIYEITAKSGKEITVYKLGITYTSRDSREDLYKLSSNEIDRFATDGFHKELEAHKKKWDSIWKNIDIRIEGDDRAQTGIRFNIYQLASSAYDGDSRVSIAAKALHGEGYKGHVFWDTEIFMLPFFIYTMPEVAKSLLLYRYNTLEGARENARSNGYKGAQFPWESADDGREVTPKWGLGYNGRPIRIWTGDEEFHINSDIAFAVWEYYRATFDRDFMFNYGLEIFFDTAKFWQSRVEYNKEKDRYEINRVIGPDEFHEHVNNNVYTNYLAKWSLKKAFELALWIKSENCIVYKKLCNKLGLCEDDFNEWYNIMNKIHIPRSKNGKLIEQFDGYFNLADIEITDYDENGMPLWPELNGYELGETQLIKQADVVMLMIMLGEEFDFQTKKENYDYYEKRTMHKSSLSPSMYSIMGLTVGDTHNSYNYFMKAIMTDIEDNQGNTGHGLHAASTGGSWQCAVFGFGGFSISSEDIPSFNPWIPAKWNEMEFSVNWRGIRINMKIRQDSLELYSNDYVDVKVYGKMYKLNNDEKLIIKR